MINRRHLLGIVPLAATLLLAGCAADSQTEQGQTADGLRAIRLTATVGDGARADTRAAIDIQSQQFEQRETFYAYFPSGASVTNSTFETSDASGNTTCTGTQPYFNAGTDNVRVHAYYPQTVTEAANQTFSVALDQTGEANYKASDLMYATTTVTKSGLSATGELHFSHKMSKIIVNASCGQGVSKIKKVRIVNGFKTIGIANPTTTNESTDPFFGQTPSRTNAITSADDGCVKLYEDATGGASVNCAGLIPPQTIDGSFLQVVTSEGTATYSLASKTFVSGESYTYSFTVSLAAVDMHNNPLWWVAQYNMAQNKTSFVTSHATSPNQYCFNFTDAATENVSGYHLPDFAEQISIVPMNKPSTGSDVTNIFGLTTNLSSPTEFSEQPSNVGGNPVAANTSIIGKKADGDFYAIRFIGTRYRSAWHYKWVTSPCNGLLIESYLLSGVTTLSQAKAKMAEASFATTTFTGSYNASGANLSPASEAVTTNGFCQRFLPACGYCGGGTDAATKGQGSYGYYRSATAMDSSNGWLWYFESGALAECPDSRTFGFSVRLFRDH